MNTCRCGCGRPPVGDLGFTKPCEQRWRLAGRPETLPPPRWTWAGRHEPGSTKADRFEDYLFIGGPRLTTREAARRLGLCQRTINRFNAILRERERYEASPREAEAA